jgi:ribosomal protection tetracycline resistance protein
MRTLRRLRIPTLIFVNKIDRGGARCGGVLREIAARLTPSIVAMGTVHRPGTRGGAAVPHRDGDPAFAAALADLLTAHDDALLAACVDDPDAVPCRRLRGELAAQARRGRVHPVFFGSAITGAGLAELTAGIRELLPASAGDPDGPPAGTVFKVERGPAGEKVTYVRMFSGTLRVRDRLRTGAAAQERVTAIDVFERGATAVRRPSVAAGQIGTLRGLAGVRIGDPICTGEPGTGQPDTGQPGTGQPGTGQRDGGQRHFAPPTLETVVLPARPADRGALHAALTELAEQDPLINVRQDGIRQEIAVSLYGEVQKEVIQATLAQEYGVAVTFRETTTICVERPAGAGAAVEVMGTGNPFLATVGLRVEPAPPGSGVAFRLAVELGSMPFAFVRAVEDTVREALRQGLYGWQVIDCAVTLTHSGYAPRQSHAHATFDKSMSSTGWDFRGLTPLVLMAALRRAGTVVYEPIHRFRLDIPADTVGAVLPALARLRAVPGAPSVQVAGCTLEGEIPAARVHRLRQLLPTLTRGEGVLEAAFDRYRPVGGEIPTRPRSDQNPLNRKEYLIQVLRRVNT